MRKKRIYSYNLNLWENEDEDVAAHLATVPNLKEYLTLLIREDIAKTPGSPAHAVLRKIQEKRIAGLQQQIDKAKEELATMYP